MNLIKNKRKKKEKVEPLNSKRRKKERKKVVLYLVSTHVDKGITKIPWTHQSAIQKFQCGIRREDEEAANGRSLFIFYFSPKTLPPTPPLPLIPDSQSPTPNSYLLISSHHFPFFLFPRFSLLSALPKI